MLISHNTEYEIIRRSKLKERTPFLKKNYFPPSVRLGYNIND